MQVRIKSNLDADIHEISVEKSQTLRSALEIFERQDNINYTTCHSFLIMNVPEKKLVRRVPSLDITVEELNLAPQEVIHITVVTRFT